MRKRKLTLFHFGTGDFKGLEEYLNRQAAKGWELERTGLLFARWKRTQRRDLSWCVDLTNPRQAREEREDYLELCRDCGWDLAVLINNMYLFKSQPDRNPIPVQTDPIWERKNYNRYYIRSIILSAVYIAVMLTFYVGVFLATEAGGILDAARYEWVGSWTMTALLFCLPVWGICALWKLAHFIGAMFRNRGGRIGVTPAWAMWANSVISAVSLLMSVVLLVGLAMDMVLTDMDSVTLYIILGMYGVAALYRTLTIEREQFPGEKRRTLMLGLCFVVIFIILIVVDVRAPYGEWSSYNDEKALEKYEEAQAEPIVRSEDLGYSLQLEGEERDYIWVTHAQTPMGEYWRVENVVWGGGLTNTGCETYAAPTRWQAKLLLRTMVDESARRVKYRLHTLHPGVELAPIELDWADEAWYGENGLTAVLVVRVGAQTTRLLTHANKINGDVWPAIEARLAR